MIKTKASDAELCAVTDVLNFLTDKVISGEISEEKVVLALNATKSMALSACFEQTMKFRKVKNATGS